MNAHALSVLEFQRTLDVVAGHASSAAGAAHVRELRPSDDVERPLKFENRERVRVHR